MREQLFLFETTKKCSNCGEVKEFDDFTRDKDGKDGLYYLCRKCKNLPPMRIWATCKIPDNKIECNGCHHLKSYDSFGSQKSKSNGKLGTCKDCYNKRRARETLLSNPLNWFVNPPENTKICIGCYKVKPLSEMVKRKEGLYENKCKDCKNAKNVVKLLINNPHRYLSQLKQQSLAIEGEAYCYNCGTINTIDYFCTNKNNLHTLCKVCKSEKQKKKDELISHILCTYIFYVAKLNIYKIGISKSIHKRYSDLMKQSGRQLGVNLKKADYVLCGLFYADNEELLFQRFKETRMLNYTTRFPIEYFRWSQELEDFAKNMPFKNYPPKY